MTTMLSPPMQRKVKGKGSQNIKVFVRCRPMNAKEKEARSFMCVDVQNNKDILVKERPMDKITKNFAFDKVFGRESKQIDVYKAVAKNSVEEVMNGFNCTIFAYGQTGTGKTFTMEGDRTPDNTNWEDDPLAGIIPRCVNHLFDELRINKCEFTMRVSFLELYNEELFDLLSAHDDLSKLRLYEDVNRKGSCVIQGLEEVLVRNKSDVYNVIEKGSAKRQTAATLMNAHSSRSHTVFTVTVHIKENTEDGDELLKTGKLHLVDLAGSENIGRSGAIDKRAREAGNINQSLLTLGRVITCLVEKTPHIPYRESKLTRLLQDALGGRTKTSIIATISPSSSNYEETLSTLEYAYRAKNIQNKPEVNQKLNKKELIGEYTNEIERLRLDLLAMREKNGVYLANENYQEMCHNLEIQAQEITDKINQIRTMEAEMEKKTELFNQVTEELAETNLKLEQTTETLGETRQTLEVTQTTLTETKQHLGKTKKTLQCTQKLLTDTAQDRDEQKHLVGKHQDTEAKLQTEGYSLIEVADITTTDITKLQDKLDRKRTVENKNEDIVAEFQQSYSDNVDTMKEQMTNFIAQKQQSLTSINESMGSSIEKFKVEVTSITDKLSTFTQDQVELLNQLQNSYDIQNKELVESSSNFNNKVSSINTSCLETIQSTYSMQMKEAIDKFATYTSENANLISNLQTTLHERLNNLSDKCLKNKNEQEVLCEEIISKVNKLSSALNKSVDSNLSSTNNIRTSTEQHTKYFQSTLALIKEQLSALELAESQQHKTTISTLTTLDTELHESARQTKSSEAEIVLVAENLKKNTSSHTDAIDTLKKETQVNMDDVCTRMESTIQHLGEERCTLDSVVDRCIQETTSTLSQVIKESAEYNQNINTKSSENVKLYSEKTQNIQSSMTESSETVSKLLVSSLSQQESNHKDVQVEVLGVEGALGGFATELHDNLCENRLQVIDLLNDKMIQDVPTGETPVRREYSYRRSISRTSPHEKILRSYRTGNINKIPLPTLDDMEDDSFTSPDVSPVLSRRNSEEMLQGSQTRLDDAGTFMVPPPPVGRQNSREDSSLSKDSGFPLSRSSSSTSLTDTKENREGTSLVRRGSTKRREIKTPTNFQDKSVERNQESRNVKVLGVKN